MELILNLFHLYKTLPLGAVVKWGGGGGTSKSSSLRLCESKVLFFVLFLSLWFSPYRSSFSENKTFL